MQRYAVVLFALAACATSSSKPSDSSASSSTPSASMSSSGSDAGTSMSTSSGATAGSSSMSSGGDTFKATLSPGNEVPPPTLDPRSSPSGSATFTVSGPSITYKVTVTGLSSPYTAAHIHSGASGVAGPVLVPLNLTQGSQGEASGEGTIDASAIKGKKADGSAMSMDELVSMMRSGGTYINVHTQNNKPGEARGQIQAGN
jgi:hypothetical protein